MRTPLVWLIETITDIARKGAPGWVWPVLGILVLAVVVLVVLV